MANAKKNSIEEIVRSLVHKYGKELYLPENELRFKGLLSDEAVGSEKELKTLKISIAEGVQSKLLASDSKDDDEKIRTIQNCKDRLADDVGLTKIV